MQEIKEFLRKFLAVDGRICYTFLIFPFPERYPAMFSFLSPDSKFMQVLSRLTDLVVLNLLFLLTCLPVFTIGAANAAMYTLCFRMIRNREGGIVKSYFRAFRDNFKQGTALWLLFLFIAVPAVIYFDAYFAMDGAIRYLIVIFFLILVLAIFAAGYGFAWISQFRNTVPEVLRNALILSLTNLPRTLCICAVNLLPWILLAVNAAFFLKISYLLLILYFSAAAYINSAILWKVFQPYYPEEIK